MLEDVELFLQVNEEYRAKPLVPVPTKYDPVSMRALGSRRAGQLESRNKIAGKRVLEIGCGHGETARALASDFGCKVVAIDIDSDLRTKWAEYEDVGVDYRVFDAASQDTATLGQFDFIYSNGTLEHVVHPFAMIAALSKMIPDGGRIHLNMGLHRGSIGSHLYRDIFFPWPHLVFTDGAHERFYQRIGRPPKRPVWINNLTSAQYMEMFDLLGLQVVWTEFHDRPLDMAFYYRFEEILNRYPLIDLSRDILYVDLYKPHPNELINLVDLPHISGNKTLKHRRFEALRNEVDRCEGIANDRLQEIREQQALLEQRSKLDGVNKELQQKIDRLELIEERFNRDLRGVRQLGRAVNWTGAALGTLVEPSLGAVRKALTAAAVSLPKQNGK